MKKDVIELSDYRCPKPAPFVGPKEPPMPDEEIVHLLHSIRTKRRAINRNIARIARKLKRMNKRLIEFQERHGKST